MKPEATYEGPTDPAAASPTLADVARLAGVSTATVSRCLNSPTQVSEATQKRVLDAVHLLGYAPNFGARALASRRTNTFGAIIPTMENAIFARGLQAFQDELAQHGITMLVASSSYSPKLEEEQIRTLVARGADALLLIGHDRTPQSYAFLDKQRIPHVVAWTFDGEGMRTSIGFDNRKAMCALAGRVLDLEHRRLGLISAPRAGNDRARERWEGIRDALSARDLDPESLKLIETPYSISGGADAFKALMTEDAAPTAVLCGNDVLAAGALTMASTLGIDVPGEVSVTGFDDIEIAQIMTPALTTVHVPHRKMGGGAARMLIAMRNGEDPGPNIELEATVKIRESLGPAPRNGK